MEPNTTYEFKVRAYNFDDTPGPYSQSIEILTPEDGKNIIQYLTSRDLNIRILKTILN